MVVPAGTARRGKAPPERTPVSPLVPAYKYLVNQQSTDTFAAFIGFPRTLSFQRDESGAVIGFELDADRILNLKFQRN